MSIREYLQRQRVWFEVLLHRPASGATRLARSLHVPGRQVAKGVLFKAGERFVLAVLPATARVDLERLARALNVPALRLADEEEVGQVFGDCERGALPPFGRLYGLTTVVDTSLSGGSEIVFVANLRHEGVRMRYRDYEALEAPLRARIAASPPRQSRPQQRRAD